jgi:hypothetical protein
MRSSVQLNPQRKGRLGRGTKKKATSNKKRVGSGSGYRLTGRIHQTILVTPAMEAGVANHVWSVEEIVGLLNLEGGLR